MADSAASKGAECIAPPVACDAAPSSSSNVPQYSSPCFSSSGESLRATRKVSMAAVGFQSAMARPMMSSSDA